MLADQQEGSPDPEWKLFPQQGYQVVTDDSLKPVALCPTWNKVKRLDAFFKKGMRRTVAAVMVTHRWLAPHLLVFLKQDVEAGQQLRCGLFSVKCKPGVNPKQTLADRLNLYLRPTALGTGQQETQQCKATVGEFLGTWWVASNSDYDHPLPYVPAHTTRPREMIRVYQVVLPPEATFCVTPGYTLKSIPIFDLVTHRPALPLAIQHLPFMIARFVFTYFEAGDDEDASRGIHDATPKPAATPAPPSPKKLTTSTEDAAQKSHVKMLVESLKDEVLQ
eukprot:Blabericola_migrator_1__3294@NODE_196_length_11523_cov_74_480883_g169_i0_p4_GENE_NODE_196_length_11523_cov_74_480883_g169_i0NODE_196_length_11523_cov_74_480883_g169_i0_p4_ORF_typecomplete_len277_score48_46NUDIX_2/PF13869_6/1_7e32_NODE_196_length_11523_cov_74_480883_g169_i01063911469